MYFTTDYNMPINPMRLCLKSDSHVKIFAKLKFSPALFEKIPSFVCLVLKVENK